MKPNPIRTAVLSVAAMILAGCGLHDPAPFNPDSIAEIQKQRAHELPERPAGDLPTGFVPPTLKSLTATRPAFPPGSDPAPTIRLSLQEILHRAVAGNSEVKVAGYQAAVDEQRILEAEARFDPTFFTNTQFQKQYPQLGVTRSLDNIVEVLSQTYQAGIRRDLPSGGQVEVSGRTSRNRANPFSSPDISPGDPVWDNELVFQVTQPLLRNFGAEVNRARITIARNDQRISEQDWRLALEKNLADLEEAYWNLARSLKDVEIQEQLLAQAEDTLSRILKRGGFDTSRVESSRSLASVEARRTLLVRTRAQVATFSDRIKRLMQDPDLPVSSAILILPADSPLADKIQFSLPDQIEAGLQNRAELLQQKYRIGSAATVVKAAKNNVLPQLNLQAQTSLLGVAPDFGNAVDRQADFDLITYSVGFAFEVPIGNRQNRAIYQRTLLQRMQTIEEYNRLVQQVVEDVKVAHRDVDTSWNEIVQSRYARFAAEDSLTAVELQERNEKLDANFLDRKLARQEELANARLSEARAMANYNIAISTLERSKGTLLRYNNIALKEAGGPRK